MSFPGAVLAADAPLEDADPAQLKEQIEDGGAILLRGYRWDLAAFEALTLGLCDRFHEVGTRVRLRQPGDGYTSEVFRENFTLLGHSEGTYRPWPPPPEVCIFGCITPPAVPGGETLVVDGVAFARALSAELRQRLLESGVRYESHWGRERWQAEFGVADTPALHALLRQLPGVRYAVEGEHLHLLYTTAALAPTPSGDLAFANGVLAHLSHIAHPRYGKARVHANGSNRVYFGDGSELDDAVINHLIDVHDRIAHPHRWQAGEVLILDNRRFMHGRRMTTVPCERVLVSRFGRLRRSP
jgi:alpha-ketoglutarate-dependent taurine dioxygenase